MLTVLFGATFITAGSATGLVRIYIVRHGHKANQEPGYDDGPNTPLSEQGHREAEQLAEFMAGETLDAVYSSCHLRALQTAEPLHDRTDGAWHAWPVFCEGSRETWADRWEENPERAEQLVAWQTGEPIATTTPEEVEEADGNYYLLSSIPELFPGARLSQPFPWPEAWWEPLAGQTHTQAYARVTLGSEALRRHHADGDRIAVVCHGISGEVLLTELMGYPWRPQRRIAFATTGVIRLDRLDTGQWRIVYLNRTDHLRQD